ncbi:MAG: hypothetical protein JW982_07225 [Spirochaetes bacterium]|nr:hypothetical protein [Spirochaetota bacterium]
MSSRLIEIKTKEINVIAEKTADRLGFQLYEIKVLFKKNNSHIDVKIDSQHPVSIDDCSLFSREFTSEIDNTGIFDNYSLEVSSPGLKRKIRTIEEFKRFEGSPVKIIYFISEEKTLASKGSLIEVDGERLVVKEDGNRITEIQFGAVKSANLDY